MKGLWAIARRELQSYFASPVAYVVFTIFLLLSGYLFFNALLYFNLFSLQASQYPWMAQQLNINQMVIQPHMHNFVVLLLFVIPLLTMRLFAEEKKQMTIELLLTSPISVGQIVLGKFLAAFVVFLGLIVLSTTFPWIVSAISDIDIGPILTGYLGVILLGGLYLAVGVFASTLTQNQIVAAVVSFGLLLLLYILPFASNALPGPMAKVISSVGFAEHFEDFTKGLIDIPALTYFLSLIVFILFLAKQIVESVRWR
ncbi:MAG: ABC transporter permease subunit [Deltaproteobacteria bacterium]|nr:ABC transporter permease subunit [Deltaproteobacteria bacterium]